MSKIVVLRISLSTGSCNRQRGSTRTSAATFQPNAKTGAHHHGELESVIYVPPFVPHQEINASREESLVCILVRSGREPIMVNLDIPAAEVPEEIPWIDSIHFKL